MVVCETCGNERDAAGGRCPFCGTELGLGRQVPLAFLQKTINIEAGRPTVDQALHRLTGMIDDALRNRITVLTIIHGYGSSGKGGVIREECRKTLDHLKIKGTIRDFIAGEHFNKRNKEVRSLLQRFPALYSNSNLNRNNRGVTLVILASGLISCLLPLITLYAAHLS